MIDKKRKYLIIIKLLIIIIIFIIMLNFIFAVIDGKKVQRFQELNKKFIETGITGDNSNGKTYYISENGTSSYGTDINNPMSLHMANTKRFYSNDKILFKRGDVFYGQVNFDIQDYKNNICYIGAYGMGNKPIISGAKTIGNIWKKFSSGIYRVQINDFNKIGGLYTKNEDSDNIGHFVDEKGNIFGSLKSTLEQLENEYDYYCDDNFFYLKCCKNPYEILGKITLATKIDLFKLCSNCDIENIELRNTGGHGFVKKNEKCKNVKIHNCILNYIGGSYQYGLHSDKKTRYGNGIELWNGAESIIIENNILKDIYDAAITLQGDNNTWKDIFIDNNIIINSGHDFELWASYSSKGMKNINIFENISLNQGKGWGNKFRPNPEITANVVFFNFSDIALMDINIVNNKYINSNRFFYFSKYSLDRVKKGINIDNNKYFYNINDYSLNNNKNNEMKSILDNLGIEKNSEFYELNPEDEEMNKLVLYMNMQSCEDSMKKINYNLNVILTKKSINLIKNKQENIMNTYLRSYNLSEINNSYMDLHRKLDDLLSNIDSVNKQKIDDVMDSQYKLISNIVELYNGNKLMISEDKFKEILIKLFDSTEYYSKIYILYIDSDDISNSSILSMINNIINRYDEQIDIDMSLETDCVNRIKEQYNKISSSNASINYFYKRRIEKELEIVNKMLEHDIKSKSDKESKMVKFEYSENLNILTNKDILISIILPNDKGKIINVTNPMKIEKNGEYRIEINIRGYQYYYTIKVQNIDKNIKEITDNSILCIGEKPRIENVKDLELYNLKKKVNNYSIGNSIDRTGFYSLIYSRDNKKEKIKFVVTDTYKNENNEEKKFLKIFENNLKVSTIIQYCNCKIKHGTDFLNNEDVVSTGDTIEIDGQTITLVVCGNITNASKNSIMNLIFLRKSLINLTTLNPVQKLAADIDDDNKISVKDLVVLRRVLVGLE